MNHPGYFLQVGRQCDSCVSTGGFSEQCCFDSSSVAFVLSYVCRRTYILGLLLRPF